MEAHSKHCEDWLDIFIGGHDLNAKLGVWWQLHVGCDLHCEMVA